MLRSVSWILWIIWRGFSTWYSNLHMKYVYSVQWYLCHGWIHYSKKIGLYCDTFEYHYLKKTLFEYLNMCIVYAQWGKSMLEKQQRSNVYLSEGLASIGNHVMCPIEDTPWNPSDYQSTIVLRSLRVAPIMLTLGQPMYLFPLKGKRKGEGKGRGRRGEGRMGEEEGEGRMETFEGTDP